MNKDRRLKQLKALTWLFINGLFISGATTLPLQTELDAFAKSWATVIPVCHVDF